VGLFCLLIQKVVVYCFYLNMDIKQSKPYSMDRLQKAALSVMVVLTLVTFVGANLQAVLWQSSEWLVSTVLPATVVDLTNKERSNLNQVPLRRNTTLDAAATLKAKHMAKNEYFSHFSPDGVSPWYWFDQSGYVYAHAGENLAIHFTDSTQVVDAWMDSPTHRENIVNTSYTEIGVGTAKGKYEGYDTVYVVQLFGSPGVAQVVVEPEIPNPVVTEPVELALLSEDIPVETAPSVLAETDAVQSDSVVVQNVESTPVSPEKPQVIPVANTEPEVTKLVVSEPAPVAQQSVVEDVEFAAAIEAPEQEVVVIKSPLISTSSGLAVASFTDNSPSHAGGTAVASIATKPNSLLQFVYIGLGFIVFLLLTASLVMEARQLRFVQVAYSALLLCGMGGLWFLNSVLTSGAVVV
jgi:uncharacterized protein YkwD